MGEFFSLLTPVGLYLLLVYSVWRWYQEHEISRLFQRASDLQKENYERLKVIADTWESKAHELQDQLTWLNKGVGAHAKQLALTPPDNPWSQAQFEAGQKAAQKILAAMEQEAAGVKIILHDNRMVAQTECNGQIFMVSFRPEQAAVAQLQVMKWKSNPSLNLCESHARELEKQIILGAKLNV